MRIWNETATQDIKSFYWVDFGLFVSKLNPSVVGQRWNSQKSWCIASMDFKQKDLDVGKLPVHR
jgi:hypothetical protein